MKNSEFDQALGDVLEIIGFLVAALIFFCALFYYSGTLCLLALAVLLSAIGHSYLIKLT